MNTQKTNRVHIGELFVNIYYSDLNLSVTRATADIADKTIEEMKLFFNQNTDLHTTTNQIFDWRGMEIKTDYNTIANSLSNGMLNISTVSHIVMLCDMPQNTAMLYLSILSMPQNISKLKIFSYPDAALNFLRTPLSALEYNSALAEFNIPEDTPLSKIRVNA